VPYIDIRCIDMYLFIGVHLLISSFYLIFRHAMSLVRLGWSLVSYKSHLLTLDSKTFHNFISSLDIILIANYSCVMPPLCLAVYPSCISKVWSQLGCVVSIPSFIPLIIIYYVVCTSANILGHSLNLGNCSSCAKHAFKQDTNVLLGFCCAALLLNFCNNIQAS